MKSTNYTSPQLFALVFLRVVIGWHLLYEGMVKVLDPSWTAEAFLQSAGGPLAGFYHHLASDNTLLLIVDMLNQWGLVLIGASLILGFLTNIGILGGMALLLLYYFASPPFLGVVQSVNTEGNYLIVNKNLVEIGGLFVLLFFRTGNLYGIDRFFVKK
jgi:thiosulfate dehydrogenase [quinone] large subunit